MHGQWSESRLADNAGSTLYGAVAYQMAILRAHAQLGKHVQHSGCCLLTICRHVKDIDVQKLSDGFDSSAQAEALLSDQDHCSSQSMTATISPGDQYLLDEFLGLGFVDIMEAQGCREMQRLLNSELRRVDIILLHIAATSNRIEQDCTVHFLQLD